MQSDIEDPQDPENSQGGNAKMSSDEISSDVIEFIVRQIRSVGHLDALMLIAQNPNTEWDAESLSSVMRTNISYATSQLEELLESKLIEKTANGKYKCCGPANRDLAVVNKLKYIYKKRPSKIISIIYDKPLQNMRGFVDAFKLRKE